MVRTISFILFIFLFSASAVSAQANRGLDLAVKLIAEELADMSASKAFDCLTLSTVKNDNIKKSMMLEGGGLSELIDLGAEAQSRVWKRVFATKVSSEMLQQSDIVLGSEVLMVSKEGHWVAKASKQERRGILSSCSSKLSVALVAVSAKLESMARDLK